MNITALPTTEESRKGFYPTPENLADRMLSGIDWRCVSRVLEPSAGKGNLVDAVLRAYKIHGWRNSGLDVDCVEIDSSLRAVLKETHAEKNDGRRVRVVHDDFLTFDTWQKYDLCVMNPPFAEGDKHLLKAIETMRLGGSIVCLLNAETLRNPYSNTRKLLARRLEELEANIEYVSGAFLDSERKTAVDVAIVKIHIEQETGESEFYSRMKKAADEKIEANPELHDLITADPIAAAVQAYNVEVCATQEFVRQYYALVPYMRASLTPDPQFRCDTDPILCLNIGSYYHNSPFNYGDYMKAVRSKYWGALMRNPAFVGKLTSKLKDKYEAEVNELSNYDFTIFNIEQVRFDMRRSMGEGIEDAIMKLFDKLTAEHSWWPECKQNVHYFNGWKTNKAHKVGTKCIVPSSMYRTEKDYSTRREYKEFYDSYAEDILEDLEKTLDYLAARPIECSTISERVLQMGRLDTIRNFPCKYFLLDAYKKGTVHIKFKPEAMELVDRLNIFAAQKRGWLPPNYGRKQYSDMDRESRAVVDSFHGNGKDGSGAAAYAEVLKRADYYLSAPARSLPALTAGG